MGDFGESDYDFALPIELLSCILQELDVQSLCKCAAVSRSWKLVSHSDQVWSTHAMELGYKSAHARDNVKHYWLTVRKEMLAKEKLQRLMRAKEAFSNRMNPIGACFHSVLWNTVCAALLALTPILIGLWLDGRVAGSLSLMLLPMWILDALLVIGFAWLMWLECISWKPTHRWKSVVSLFYSELPQLTQRLTFVSLIVCLILQPFFIVLRVDFAPSFQWTGVFTPMYVASLVAILALLTGCGQLSLRADDETGGQIRVASMLPLPCVGVFFLLLGLKLDGYLSSMSWLRVFVPLLVADGLLVLAACSQFLLAFWCCCRCCVKTGSKAFKRFLGTSAFVVFLCGPLMLEGLLWLLWLEGIINATYLQLLSPLVAEMCLAVVGATIVSVVSFCSEVI